ncbi:MAG: Ig-like domain-containing protein, partial [Paludibacter sp.]|nr:Ig-like domain-containing protein [Bacteroidales bacterium]MCM1069536.1 Ig-like domain-containing protein [Prevotella sp.]MCM1354709.1 Ig-like domain-containing protein [Bacteroides sp.]MCM1443558.1 Ig-like domain-containing protein [Muribaculum sp.]MCM1482673.1 Ig-like domain-containing protein [Paludibacter sp.]
ATITVTTEDGNFTATCLVTVKAASTGTDYSTIHTSNVELTTEGGENTYTATVNGNTAIKAGTGSKAGAVTIMVPAYTTKLYLHAAAWNKENVVLGITGATATPASLSLTADAAIAGGSNDFTLSFADEFFFEVELKDITKLTTLTFKATSGYRFVIWGVNYEQTLPEAVPATAVELNCTTLSLEQYKNTVAMVATVTPANSTDIVEWISSNPEVATISLSGVITALKEGTTTITAKAGAVSATCELTVTAPVAISCAKATELAAAVSGNNVPAKGGKYVIHGYVVEEAGKGFDSDMATYGNITFWMSDEFGGANTFEAYQVLPLDKENLPKVGDFVEIVGDITKYNTTYETMGKGSATVSILKAYVEPIVYELNGGMFATPASNEALWEMFKPDYNTFYGLARADQPIDKVTTFASEKMQEFVTSETSSWKWLGDYISAVVAKAGFAGGTLTTEVLWRFNVQAFFNCSAEKSSTWNGNPDFTEAGKYEAWIGAWTVACGLPEHVDAPYTLPVPTREGYTFEGWYDNAEFTGEAITVINADTKGTLYAKWKSNEPTAIDNIVAELDFNAPMYNVLGQPVNSEYKGVVIQNGNKYLLR